MLHFHASIDVLLFIDLFLNSRWSKDATDSRQERMYKVICRSFYLFSYFDVIYVCIHVIYFRIAIFGGSKFHI